MNEKRTYKRYPVSFKEEAVALVAEQGYTVIEAAKSLGIRPNQLYDWKAKLEAQKSGEALSVDEREELVQEDQRDSDIPASQGTRCIKAQLMKIGWAFLIC
jgi:transposase